MSPRRRAHSSDRTLKPPGRYCRGDVERGPAALSRACNAGVPCPCLAPARCAPPPGASAATSPRCASPPRCRRVYDPLDYARRAHAAYLDAYAGSRKRVVFLGMNPGPFGMAQTGVPFGDVAQVRDFLGIEAPVGRPASEHPKRPVQGFACARSEVSGTRLWGAIAAQFGTPARFFADHFVANYCPLLFLEASGRNRTPDKLPAAERERALSRLRSPPAAPRRGARADLGGRRRRVCRGARARGARRRRARGARAAPEPREPARAARLGRDGAAASCAHRESARHEEEDANGGALRGGARRARRCAGRRCGRDRTGRAGRPKRDPNSAAAWREQGRAAVAAARALAPQRGPARNVIVFIGDGMGVSDGHRGAHPRRPAARPAGRGEPARVRAAAARRAGQDLRHQSAGARFGRHRDGDPHRREDARGRDRPRRVGARSACPAGPSSGCARCSSGPKSAASPRASSPPRA